MLKDLRPRWGTESHGAEQTPKSSISKEGRGKGGKVWGWRLFPGFEVTWYKLGVFNPRHGTTTETQRIMESSICPVLPGVDSAFLGSNGRRGEGKWRKGRGRPEKGHQLTSPHEGLKGQRTVSAPDAVPTGPGGRQAVQAILQGMASCRHL